MKDYVFLEKAIFTFEDVLSTGLNREGALSALSNLKNAKKIVRLRKGLYATINPITKAPYASIYEIGCAIHRGGVIGYLSALHFSKPQLLRLFDTKKKKLMVLVTAL